VQVLLWNPDEIVTIDLEFFNAVRSDPVQLEYSQLSRHSTEDCVPSFLQRSTSVAFGAKRILTSREMRHARRWRG